MEFTHDYFSGPMLERFRYKSQGDPKELIDAVQSAGEARPCPFCGCKAKVSLSLSYPVPMVVLQCSGCHVHTVPITKGTWTHGKTLDTFEDVMSHLLGCWNKRVGENGADKLEAVDVVSCDVPMVPVGDVRDLMKAEVRQ